MILQLHSIELLRENDPGAAEVALELAVMDGDEVIWSASSRDAISAWAGDFISGSRFTAFDEGVPSEGGPRIEGHEGQALRIRIPDGLHWYLVVVERDRKAMALGDMLTGVPSSAPPRVLALLADRITSRYGSSWQGWAVILGSLLHRIGQDDPLCAAVGFAGDHAELDFVVKGPTQGPSAQVHLTIEPEGDDS